MAYYVSDPENQEEIKESLSNYKNMTVEGAKVSYELNKKLFNDFVDYATSKGGGSAAVYTADGKSYTVNEMAAAGFPEFDDWDKEMKKTGKSYLWRSWLYMGQAKLWVRTIRFYTWIF